MKASGFLEKLQSGDAVMADKGLNIQDSLALHKTVLIARPVMMKNNVSALASIATRHVATARVHIERIIKRVKSFNFFIRVNPLTCKPYTTQVEILLRFLLRFLIGILKGC